MKKDLIPINPYTIQQALPQLKIIYYSELASTNPCAKQLLLTSNTDQIQVVITSHQTGGYGRQGRTFSSPATGGIYLTLAIPLTDQELVAPGLITTAAGVGVVRTLTMTLKQKAQIKWVNDVLVAGKKVCGILTEVVLDEETNQVRGIVLGIGINYLSQLSDFPPELHDRIGTLAQAAQANHCSSTNFTIALLTQVLTALKERTQPALMAEYRQYSVVIGHEVTLNLGNQKITGRVQDINDQGELVLTSGAVFSAGEVVKLR
ncbi:biotin--[acetyl-CoA-carboxylase] ligase [Ligilactobacillus saerimneri]|uniref:biotin--[acetyl-CoA-carboxylase] ligase n=1 Tax=Ligilactobacillus saerimneri TaxID=228229 RepID=UPI0022A8086C|nr:biotin--[acetyl-CoA-carboxylase] ligase [Ligilactobacillus saerimneri]MCZ0892362.1 biotin--[acetyl-CoA-carboxylase] ligase [Ligilactobacillus saerimneri]